MAKVGGYREGAGAKSQWSEESLSVLKSLRSRGESWTAIGRRIGKSRTTGRDKYRQITAQKPCIPVVEVFLRARW
jgi:hypothetical protein